MQLHVAKTSSRLCPFSWMFSRMGFQTLFLVQTILNHWSLVDHNYTSERGGLIRFSEPSVSWSVSILFLFFSHWSSIQKIFSTICWNPFLLTCLWRPICWCAVFCLSPPGFIYYLVPGIFLMHSFFLQGLLCLFFQIRVSSILHSLTRVGLALSSKGNSCANLCILFPLMESWTQLCFPRCGGVVAAVPAILASAVAVAQVAGTGWGRGHMDLSGSAAGTGFEVKGLDQIASSCSEQKATLLMVIGVEGGVTQFIT